ncbi:uncharacterized protein LOC141665278 [Apium graveolens]|uniref:uncharacterized protein LOC141665278 n=1 Tax=Apium graveolens TaxID=4045 RepID=UPI003D7A92D7
MKPIRTRIVKKRVKQRDPLIPRVFLPIPEESFELPDQMASLSSSTERTETDPVDAQVVAPVSEQILPPLPPEPAPEIPLPPEWEDLEPQIPMPPVEIPEMPPMEPEAEPPVYAPMEQPVLFPAPLAIYAPVPGVYQFPQPEFMDEIVLVGQYHEKNKPCDNIAVGLDYDAINSNKKNEGDKGKITVSEDVPAMLRKVFTFVQGM